jgi:hypothetical protein
MQSAVLRPPVGVSDSEFQPVFNVLIAYEDFETGKHAKVTYDYLVEHLGRDCTFCHQMWKFDVLSVAKLAEIAAKDAQAADIIIISCRSEELPEHVRTWIETSIGGKANPIALVTLFDCPPHESYRMATVRSYLADIAERGRMEFFAQPDDWPGRPRTGLNPLLERSAPLNDFAFSAIAGAVHQNPFPRWGINE